MLSASYKLITLLLILKSSFIMNTTIIILIIFVLLGMGILNFVLLANINCQKKYVQQEYSVYRRITYRYKTEHLRSLNRMMQYLNQQLNDRINLLQNKMANATSDKQKQKLTDRISSDTSYLAELKKMQEIVEQDLSRREYFDKQKTKF